jgi:hypothetical protein
MKRIKYLLVVAALGCVTAAVAQAQDNNADNNNNNGDRRGRFGRGGFGDPAQMQQRALDNARDALEVKDDKEWQALEPLVKNVLEKATEARREGMSSMGRLLFGRGGRPGGDNNNDGGGDRGRRFGGAPAAELDALDKAIEAKATNAELKAAIAKLQEARKAKQAELEKAQADLRKVLTTKQEAVATSMGLL